jgi:hypothetical protein
LVVNTCSSNNLEAYFFYLCSSGPSYTLIAIQSLNTKTYLNVIKHKNKLTFFNSAGELGIANKLLKSNFLEFGIVMNDQDYKKNA